MSTMTSQLLEAHQQELPAPGIDLELLQECVEACSACEQASTVCASGMSGEGVAACLNAADMANTMMRAMLRPKGMHLDGIMALLHATVAVCDAAVAALTRNDAMGEDARLCAEACRECSASCRGLLDYMRSTMQWA